MSRMVVRYSHGRSNLVRIVRTPWPEMPAGRSPWLERIGRVTLAAALAMSVLATAILFGVR